MPTNKTEQDASGAVACRLDRPVGRLPANVQKPRIRRLLRGGWLCEGGNLGGIAWTPTGAYRAWLWNMLHHGEPHRLAEYGLTA